MALQNFIVLGIIPGTNIQISFQLWLTVVLLTVAVWELRRMLHSTVLVAMLLTRTFNKSVIALPQVPAQN